MEATSAKAPLGRKARREAAKAAEKEKKRRNHEAKRKAAKEEPLTRPKQPPLAQTVHHERQTAPPQKKQKKRPRGAEVDPLISAEDAEIARLERLLGVRGADASKKRLKLDKELAEDDGFGEDFVGFLNGLDRITAPRRKGHAAIAVGEGLSEEDSAPSDGDGALSEDDSAPSDNGDSEGQEQDEESDGTTALAGGAELEEADDAFDSGGGSGSESGGDSGEDVPLAGSGDDDGAAVASDGETYRYQPRQGEDIYGRIVDPGVAAAAPAKYVPPHLRVAKAPAIAAAASQDTANGSSIGGSRGTGGEGDAVRLRRAVTGLVNRLSVESLDPVARALADLYRTHSTTLVSEAVLAAALAACVHDKQIMTPLIPAYAGLMAGLGAMVGRDVSAFFLEDIARRLDAALSAGRSGNAGGSSGGGAVSSRARAANLLLLLAYMYGAGVVHVTVMWGLVRAMAGRLNPIDVECLALLLAHCGPQLRADDSSALREIGKLVEATAASKAARAATEPAAEEEATAKEGDNEESSGDSEGRLRFMMDELASLSGGKKRGARRQQQTQERTRQLKKWVTQVRSSSAGTALNADIALRIPWEDLVSPEGRGRWWRVGAAWAGAGGSGSGASAAGGGGGGGGGGASGEGGESGAKSSSSNGAIGMGRGADGAADDASDAAEPAAPPRLLKMAAALRMNTGVRRSIFLALMGASDFEDAFERLAKLELRGEQEREVARVLMACCGAEKAYNSFYALVAARFCEYQPRYRFTLQLAFWDAWKSLEEQPARKAANLARLLAELLLTGRSLSLSALRAVDVAALGPTGLIFFRVLFRQLFSEPDDSRFLAVFQRLGRASGSRESTDGGGGGGDARDVTLVLLKAHAAAAPSEWPEDRRKHYRKRFKAVTRALDTMAVAMEFG